ncbi:MAG TPA: protein kinase [Polyangiaceae bacterium]|nr:protein kinase [Polyangiaceae bacterium]
MTEGPLKPGDRIAEKYVLEKELGRGGMGIVFLAQDTDLERPVAIKVLLEEHVADQGAVTRFLREAKASVKIQSEHVARIYETGRLSNGVPFIVMEYLEGQDLADRLELKGAMTEAQIADVVLQACEALAEAHAAGIVHRDLKPANLFLARRPDGSEALKILDFGISKISTSSVLTKSQTLVGSPYYMSPEQLESAQDVDARADIWAAGVIMYELSTGQRPFEGNSLAALCVSVLNASPKPLEVVKPSTTPEFAAVVARCLQKNRDQRFQNVGELANALDALRGPGVKSGSAERVTRVLQNARTVPDIPRRESDPTAERSASWAQTNREATAQQLRGRRVLLASVVIVAAAGVGVALGQLAQRQPANQAAFGAPPHAEAPRLTGGTPSIASSAISAPPTSAEVTPAVVRDAEPTESEALAEAGAQASSVTSSAMHAGVVDTQKAGPKTTAKRAPASTANVERTPKVTPEAERDPFLRRH